MTDKTIRKKIKAIQKEIDKSRKEIDKMDLLPCQNDEDLREKENNIIKFPSKKNGNRGKQWTKNHFELNPKVSTPP